MLTSMSEMTQQLETRGAEPNWTLGWRLRRSLDYADVSVEQMATELGYERKTLSRWMHDQITPRPVVLKQWALRCGVSHKWLVNGAKGGGTSDADPHPGPAAGPVPADAGPDPDTTEQPTRALVAAAA
jgi:ribosome-binding protein aMBF1 (putative translation factor)